MKGLLIKDLKLFLGTRNFIVVLVGLFLLITGDTPDMGIGYTLYILVFLSISLISYDEFDNGMPFLITLPGGRKTYVNERYIFTLVTSIITALVLSFLSAGLLFIRGENIDAIRDIFFTTIILYAVSNMFCSIVIPFMLKFGAEKGRFAMIGLFGIVYVVSFIGMKYLDNSDQSLYILDSIFEALHQLSMIQISGILFLCTIIALGISWIISQRIMAKKEF